MPVVDKVTAIIVEQLGVAASAVTPDATFRDELGADSLDMIEMALACEAEFDVEVPDHEIDWVRVRDLVAYIGRRVTPA